MASVQRLAAPAGWHAYLYPLPGLPVPREHRPALAGRVDTLVRRIQAEVKSRSVFLLFDELHTDNAVREVARYGRGWRPNMGLGLLPEAAPPRLWTEQDLTDRDYDSPMPALKHTVAHLDTDGQEAAHACQTMAGTASLVQVLHQAPTEALLDAWYRTFQPTVQEEAFAAYPLYVPLLSTASLSAASDRLETWMGRADVYLRESAPDRGLFLLSRFSLDAHLRDSGFAIDRDQHTAAESNR